MINLRQNKAFALTFSLLFLFLIISFMAVYITVVASGMAQANRLADGKKAYYVAEAGLVDAYQRIAQAGSTLVIPSAGSLYIPSDSTDDGTYAIGNSTGTYSVTVEVSAIPRTNYTITSTGTFGKATKTLQLKMIWASISKYAYWSQTEVNPQFGQLWWVGAPGLQMVTTGPVQTNGTLNIFGNPIFNGVVTQANGDGGSTPNYYYGTGTSGLQSDTNTIFPEGITNNAPTVSLPPQNTLSFINAVATDGEGMVLTGNSTVIFNPTGTVTVTGNVIDASCQTTATYNNTTIPAPANGVIYVQSSNTIPACQSSATDGNVTVQGTVNGQLTVAADQNIYISGSVAYNSDPRTNPSSTDMVGLVAQQNITVIAASAPAQLEMAAVLMAMSGSFQVDQWWVNKGDASTAVMDQFGSLINYVCGVTGEMDLSGNLLGGWNQIQSYDSRLATIAPPGFPPLTTVSGTGIYSKLSITECMNGLCG